MVWQCLEETVCKQYSIILKSILEQESLINIYAILKGECSSHLKW